jgi:hypothetical protein
MKLTVLLALVLGFLSQNAYAVERTVQAAYESATREVHLLVEDVKESSSACDYHVQKMSYDRRNKVVSLALAEEPCFVDVIAKKKVLFKWSLPRSLHMKSFCLKVDGKYMARVAFDASNVTVSQSCK